MKPEEYDAWYETPRGRWISNAEWALLHTMLRPDPEGSALDVGCGTGHFTRRLARCLNGRVTGIDPDPAALHFARSHAFRDETYLLGRGEALPFADGAFDYGVSVAAVCFIADERRALSELLRVTKKRFAIGLLNRHSLLWRHKGRGGGKGAYPGARWHTSAELRQLLDGLPVAALEVRSAILLPGGGALARLAERAWPSRWPLGAFLCLSGEVVAN